MAFGPLIPKTLAEVRDGHELAILLAVKYERLTYYARRKKIGNYTSWNISKKGGGSRLIVAPISPIKLLQRKIADELKKIYSPRKHVHGLPKVRTF